MTGYDFAYFRWQIGSQNPCYLPGGYLCGPCMRLFARMQDRD
jgi:hypothetical protein